MHESTVLEDLPDKPRLERNSAEDEGQEQWEICMKEAELSK